MDSTYAPQSPDLSSFLSSKTPPSPPDTSYRPQQSRKESYDPQQSQEQSYQPSSYAPRSTTLPFTQNPPQLQDQHQDQHESQRHPYPHDQRAFPEYANSTHYMPPIPTLSLSHGQAYSGAPTSSPYYQQPIKTEPSYNRYDGASDSYNPNGSMSRTPRGLRVKDEPSTLLSSAPQGSTKPPPPSIDIKTKFPVARIKRIMQADEEVGKVAQVTPVAVNKALELFMTALVLGAAERAREKGGKRITAGHLKSVVEADEQFDFLGEIVGRVQESAEGEKKRKGGRESDSEEEHSGERKVKKGKGRRKKSEE